MRVTIIGPNLSDQSKGQFYVHRENCDDIRRDPRGYGYRQASPHMNIEAGTQEDVAGYVFEDHMDESESGSPWATAAAYLDEFHFAPCATLPHR